jgi:general secretion pathway protein E
MITLYEDGLRKVVQGETSVEEVLRVTQDQSADDELVGAVAGGVSKTLTQAAG